MQKMERWKILAAVVFLTAVNCFGAGDKGAALAGPQALGTLVGKAGMVRVDNEEAPPIESLFAGDVVRTEKDSAAILTLGRRMSATVEQESEVALSPSGEKGTLTLRKGTVGIRTEGVDRARVDVAGTSVEVGGEGAFPSVCRIAEAGRFAEVFADRGRVEIHGSGTPVIVPAGKSVRLDAAPQTSPGGQPQAGKVSAAIPSEDVKHQGQTTEIPLNLADPVYWQDLVQTMRTGRVRIQLLDGSFLNVGARSQMQIVKHDPQTQQTDIEMSLGRMRAEVVKLTKSGSHFQVRTQTAVIGVTGTIFVVDATAKLTRVFCMEGSVLVRNINPAVLGEVTIHAGQFTSVHAGLAPTALTASPQGLSQSELSNTDVQGGAQNLARAGGLGTHGVTTTASTVTHVAEVGTSATSAGLAGAAASNLGGVSSTLNSATQALNNATTTSSQATTASNNAVSSSATALQDISQSTCGCGP